MHCVKSAHGDKSDDNLQPPQGHSQNRFAVALTTTLAVCGIICALVGGLLYTHHCRRQEGQRHVEAHPARHNRLWGVPGSPSMSPALHARLVVRDPQMSRKMSCDRHAE